MLSTPLNLPSFSLSSNNVIPQLDNYYIDNGGIASKSPNFDQLSSFHEANPSRYPNVALALAINTRDRVLYGQLQRAGANQTAPFELVSVNLDTGKVSRAWSSLQSRPARPAPRLTLSFLSSCSGCCRPKTLRQQPRLPLEHGVCPHPPLDISISSSAMLWSLTASYIPTTPFLPVALSPLRLLTCWLSKSGLYQNPLVG